MQKKPPKDEVDDSRQLLRSIIKFMKQNQQLELQELIGVYTDISPEDTIPVSIFAQGLSPSEALCKYLKENCNLNYHDIAILIGRDDRSVWTSYARAQKKSKDRLKSKEDDLLIPVAVFQDRKNSILEHVVSYLKSNYNLSNSRIAKLTRKNPSAIATVAKRAEAKKDHG